MSKHDLGGAALQRPLAKQRPLGGRIIYCVGKLLRVMSVNTVLYQIWFTYVFLNLHNILPFLQHYAEHVTCVSTVLNVFSSVKTI